MQKYYKDVTDIQGNVIAGVSVNVVDSATGLPAVIYSDNGITPIVGAIVTDNHGYFEFYAANGRYNISLSSVRIQTYSITDILLYDPADVSSVTFTTLIVLGAGNFGSINVTNAAVLRGTVSLGGAFNAEGFRVVPVASAVNPVQVTGGVTGSPPVIQSIGSDAAVPLRMMSKDASIQLFTSSTVRGFNVVHVINGVNYLQAQSGTAGNPAVLTAGGADPNSDIFLVPMGTGVLRFGTFTGNADAPVTGYITVKDAVGTLRKLATIA